MKIFAGNSKLGILVLPAVLTSVPCVTAHGHVLNLVVNGVYYETYDSTSFPYQANPPTVAGWTIDQLDNGFVLPESYYDPDIICHRSATPGQGHIEVKAGDTITLQWSETWPRNHHGPVVDYLANCYGPCESVDKTELAFFKIDGVGLLEQGSQGTPGRYASDVFKDNGCAWNVRIPKNIKSGNYVLRHEIIALHNAIDRNGAQHYPQCFNLKITGGGSDTPIGYSGTQLYDATDPGILINIYDSSVNYQVPGPTIIEGGVSSVTQRPSTAHATASCTIGY